MPNKPYQDSSDDYGWHCFPANTQVEMIDGTTKYVADVEVGDEVKVLNEDGSLSESEVWCKAHDDPNSIAEYLEIDTDTHRLHISRRHFLPVTDEDQLNTTNKMATNVKVGDYLTTVDDGKKCLERVQVIEEINGKGVFAPFTKSGQILINGVQVSCYAEVDPNIAHTALAALRATYDVTPKVVMDTLLMANKQGVPHIFHETLKVLKPLVASE